MTERRWHSKGVAPLRTALLVAARRVPPSSQTHNLRVELQPGSLGRRVGVRASACQGHWQSNASPAWRILAPSSRAGSLSTMIRPSVDAPLDHHSADPGSEDRRSPTTTSVEARHDWWLEEIRAVHGLPLLDLVFHAATVHRRCQASNEVQVCKLISIKTGACPEDCAYCSQSARYDTGIEPHRLMDKDAVVDIARRAKENGVR